MKCANDIIFKATIEREMKLALEEKLRREKEERERKEKEEKARYEEEQRQLKIQRAELRVARFCEDILAPIIEANAEQGILITKINITTANEINQNIEDFFTPVNKHCYANSSYKGGFYYRPVCDSPDRYNVNTSLCISYLKQFCYDCIIQKVENFPTYGGGYVDGYIMTIEPIPNCL